MWSVKKFDPENPTADDDVDPEADAAVDELKITREQYRDYKEAFDSYDKDGGGTLDQDELMHAMKSLGYDPSENDVAEYLQAVSKAGLAWLAFFLRSGKAFLLLLLSSRYLFLCVLGGRRPQWCHRLPRVRENDAGAEHGCRQR